MKYYSQFLSRPQSSRLWPRLGILSVACGVLSLVAGCTTTPPDDSSTASETLPVTTAPSQLSNLATPHVIPHAQQTTLIEPPPPLAAYAPYMDGPPLLTADVEASKERFDNVQSAIASCMAAQGFQYVPVAANLTILSQATWFGNHLRLFNVPFLAASRDVVAQDGYGVMGTPDEEAAAAGVADDPNLAYQETLGQSEAQAYSTALYGDFNDPTGTSMNSCSGKATAQFPEPDFSTSRQAVFQAEYGSLVGATINYVDIAMGVGALAPRGEDPRVAQLISQWESCMTAKGYEFDESATGVGPVEAFFIATLTRPDGTYTWPANGTAANTLPREETSLIGSEAERKVALADFDCRVSTNYIDRLTAIRVDLDNAYLQTNKVALDNLVAAAQLW